MTAYPKMSEEITKLLFALEPRLLDAGDMDANAKTCVALAEVLGALMASLKVKYGQAYYEKSIAAVVRQIDSASVDVFARAMAIAKNDPGIQRTH